MKAAIIDNVHSIHLREEKMPELLPGQSLVKVKYCGICGTDVHVLHGSFAANLPIIPGHEFVGELVEVCGDGAERYALGDLVVAQPFFSCGNCQACAQGKENICQSIAFMGTRTNGAFAEYVRVPTRKMYTLPAGFDAELAGLTEPLAVAVHDVRRSGLQVGEAVLVIGGGAIGLLEALVSRRAGARLVVISEISEYRRGLAESMGFATVNPLDERFEETLAAMAGGQGYDVVFEASGTKQGVATAVKHAKIAGTIMIIGVAKEPAPVDFQTVFLRELVLQGVRIHSQYSFMGAIEILKSGELDDHLRKLVTNVFPFDKVEDAFKLALGNGDFMKILVHIS